MEQIKIHKFIKPGIIILVLLLLTGGTLVSKEKKNLVKFSFLSETYAEVALGDYDNTNGFQLQLAKNVPEIEQVFEMAWMIRSLNNKNLSIGPYLNLGSTIRFDYPKSTGPTSLSLERNENVGELGFRVRYRLRKKGMKGSRLVASLPVYVETGLRFTNPPAVVFPTSQNDVRRFHTAVMVGVRPELALRINLNKYFIRLRERVRVPLLFDVLNLDYAFNDYRMLVGVDNDFSIAIAPFNFINKKVDLWITGKLETDFYWVANQFEFSNEAWLEIKWTGFKHIHLGFKPVWHDFSFNTPLDTMLPGDQEQTISMDAWVKFRVKIFEFTVGYRPYLYAIDGAEINLDEDKPHYIYTEMVFDI
jgi:hypothetical protein